MVFVDAKTRLIAGTRYDIDTTPCHRTTLPSEKNVTFVLVRTTVLVNPSGSFRPFANCPDLIAIKRDP